MPSALLNFKKKLDMLYLKLQKLPNTNLRPNQEVDIFYLSDRFFPNQLKLTKSYIFLVNNSLFVMKSSATYYFLFNLLLIILGLTKTVGEQVVFGLFKHIKSVQGSFPKIS